LISLLEWGCPNGQQVDLIELFKENVGAFNANCATVIGDFGLHQPVILLTPEKIAGTYDLNNVTQLLLLFIQDSIV
jgi:hypothetical protein